MVDHQNVFEFRNPLSGPALQYESAPRSEAAVPAVGALQEQLDEQRAAPSAGLIRDSPPDMPKLLHSLSTSDEFEDEPPKNISVSKFDENCNLD